MVAGAAVAAKHPAAKKSTAATVAKKSTIHKAKPKGLVLSAAQWKAYNKAYNAAASAVRTKIAFRAAVGRLRKYRLNAAYATMKSAAAGESLAASARIAAYAARQSWLQSKLAHQNQALQNKIEQDMYKHANLAGKLQFAAAGEKAYAHAAIMRTLDESQANAYERKVFNAVSRTAKAAKGKKVKYLKGKSTPASRAVAAAGRAAGLRAAEAPNLVAAAKRSKAASQAKAHATASRTAKAHTKATLAADRAKRKQAHGVAAQSKKAPVAKAKARTSPQFGQPSRMQRFPKPKPVQWIGDEEQPLCIVYAIANHLLHIKNFHADDKALAELAELAGDDPTIEGTLWQVYLTGWPQGSLLHLTNYKPVEDALFGLYATLKLVPLVVGYEHAYEEDGEVKHADHAALSLPDGRVVTWGAIEKLTAEVEEAWELRWDT